VVDLREPAATADEQENKLPLALFSAPPATSGADADSSWVAFPSNLDDASAATSAWQTPAVEPGKAYWELASQVAAQAVSGATRSRHRWRCRRRRTCRWRRWSGSSGRAAVVPCCH
jgi:hypothetical protein